jgi:predicted phage tail component-like protein
MITVSDIDLVSHFGKNPEGQDVFSVIDILGRGPLSQEINRLSISERAGSIYQRRRKPERLLSVIFLIRGESLTDLQNKLDELNEILDFEKPASISFSDEEDKEYFGIPEGDQEWEEIGRIGKGTIHFLCPDPYKYGPSYVQAIPNDGVMQVFNTGKTDTYPAFNFNVLKNITHLDIYSIEGLMRIGEPAPPEVIPVEPKTLIKWHEAQTTVGWTPSSDVEGGVAQGTMSSNGYEFRCSDYGSTISGWHGPAIKQSLSQPLADFRMDIEVNMFSEKVSSMGSVEVALLDANNQFVTKINITKRFSNEMAIYPSMRAGTEEIGMTVFNPDGPALILGQRYKGLLRIERVGTYWKGTMFKRDDEGFLGSAITQYWEDDEGIATNQVTQVQAQLWAYSDKTPTSQGIEDIKVYKINDVTEDQVPIIARYGDDIEVDFSTSNITINGEPRVDLRNFGTTFFPLKKGENHIIVSPAESVDGTVKWRNRYL